MKKHNFWGDPDDVEPLPDWMNPETYRNPKKKRYTKTLEEAIQEVLKKPPMIQEGMTIDLSGNNNEQ